MSIHATTWCRKHNLLHPSHSKCSFCEMEGREDPGEFPYREAMREIVAQKTQPLREMDSDRKIIGAIAENYHRDVASKATNPKDIVGIRKVGLASLPIRVLWRVGLGMLEGALKYGRHNYRAVGVRSSVYFDAACRHLFAWWEGEDIDPDSGLHHLDKLLACLFVLRDSMLGGNYTDDRPPRAQVDFAELNAHAGRLMDKHADKHPKHYTVEDPHA